MIQQVNRKNDAARPANDDARITRHFIELSAVDSVLCGPEEFSVHPLEPALVHGVTPLERILLQS
jgi:hypothetical protein